MFPIELLANLHAFVLCFLLFHVHVILNMLRIR